MSFLITKFIFFYITSNSLVDDSDDELSSTGIFENQLKSEKKVNKVCKKKEVLISSDHPVMVCNKTLNKLHKCVFCKCYECYMIELKNEDENGNLVDKTGNNNKNNLKHCRKRSSRCRKARNISEGQTTETYSKKKGSTVGGGTICNHTDDLSIFTDASFFSRSYKTRNEKVNDSGKAKVYLPIYCSVCKAEICNKVSVSKGYVNGDSYNA